MPNLIAKGEVTIDTAVDKVWEALVDPRKIKEYMFGAHVTSSWTKGSPITWKGEMNGTKYEDKGEILAIEPGKKLSYSYYSPLSKLPDTPENYHVVTIHLMEEKGKTRIR